MVFRLGLSSLAAIGIAGVVGTPTLAQANALNFLRPGVVCDALSRICYDSMIGPSIEITGEIYGPFAAQNLRMTLSQTGPRNEFRLSSGQMCFITKRTCFDDGLNQRQVAYKLSQHLYGSTLPTPGQGTQVSRDRGLCSVSRGSEAIFDGTCVLKQVLINGQNRYEVRLQNGNRFEFMQQGSSYVIRDGFGTTWPVTFVDHGNTGIFRFGGYVLVATQIGATRQPSTGQTLGSALGTLLNSLFQ